MDSNGDKVHPLASRRKGGERGLQNNDVGYLLIVLVVVVVVVVLDVVVLSLFVSDDGVVGVLG